jgi:hypothetical protein
MAEAFALEAAAIGRGLDQIQAELAVRDGRRCGGVGERQAIGVEIGRGQAQVEVEGARRREREGLRAPGARRVEESLRRSEQRLERQRVGGERAGDGRTAAGVADRERAFQGLPGAGQSRLAKRQRVRLSLDLARDREVAGGQKGRRLEVEESRQGGDRGGGCGQIAVGAELVSERDHAAERKLDQRRIEPERKRARDALRRRFRIGQRANDRKGGVAPPG